MAPADKRPLKVFLCHASADRDAVRGLYTRLKKDGVDAWLDKEKLLPGQDWEYEIRKAVREADVVVVCLSTQFNQAGFRQKEVRLALDTAMEQPEGEIFIIPARLEECDTLESLRKWHWVNLFEDDGYDLLVRALVARANKIGMITQVKKDRSDSGESAPVIVGKWSGEAVWDFDQSSSWQTLFDFRSDTVIATFTQNTEIHSIEATWSLVDNNITMKFPLTTYTGVLSGDEMRGQMGPNGTWFLKRNKL